MARRKSKYYVRPDGLHETIRKINGKRVAFRGHTDAEVDRKMIAYEQKLNKVPTFREVSEAWEEVHLPTLTPNTARGYRSQNRMITEYFGDYLVTEITPVIVQAYLSSHLTQAKKTITNRLLTLNLIFNYAVVQGYITTNPCSAVRITKGRPTKHRNAPTEEETRIIKAYASDPDGLMPALILCTGCRKGEAMGLLDTDIDHKNKELHITRSVYFEDGIPKTKPPKSDAGTRITPLPDFLLELLPKTRKGRPLFPNDKGEYMKACQFEKMWGRWQEKTKLTLTAHQIRHGYATILYENEISAKDAQTFLGHAQLSTTMDIYTHVRKAHREAMSQKVNQAINNI